MNPLLRPMRKAITSCQFLNQSQLLLQLSASARQPNKQQLQHLWFKHPMEETENEKLRPHQIRHLTLNLKLDQKKKPNHRFPNFELVMSKVRKSFSFINLYLKRHKRCCGNIQRKDCNVEILENSSRRDSILKMAI